MSTGTGGLYTTTCSVAPTTAEGALDGRQDSLGTVQAHGHAPDVQDKVMARRDAGWFIRTKRMQIVTLAARLARELVDGSVKGCRELLVG